MAREKPGFLSVLEPLFSELRHGDLYEMSPEFYDELELYAMDLEESSAEHGAVTVRLAVPYLHYVTPDKTIVIVRGEAV